MADRRSDVRAMPAPAVRVGSALVVDVERFTTGITGPFVALASANIACLTRVQAAVPASTNTLVLAADLAWAIRILDARNTVVC